MAVPYNLEFHTHIHYRTFSNKVTLLVLINYRLIQLEYNFHKGIGHWDDNELSTLQLQCDLAAAVQERFEIEVGKVMRLAKTLTNADCLVYMGGCAMNNAANRNEVEPQFKYIWSLPDPGDPSSSIGAVTYHTKQRIRKTDWAPVKHIAINI